MKKIEVHYHEILNFLLNLPEERKMSLPGDLVKYSPAEITDHIQRKTGVGKKFFLKIGKLIYLDKVEKKKNGLRNKN